MASRPTAIISYSHDSPRHSDRVLLLADRLRGDGVECELDAYQVSPPEGWPAWMRRQVQERDFCIVVCTETYARRFAGDETPGVGKGAKWEGRLLRQILYDEGKNDRVIPVVFDPDDLHHIPLELRDATYYDLSSPDGYERLHRALTAQPLIEPGAVGPLRKHLPLLAPREREAVTVLVACPEPLPIDVVAAVAGVPADQVDTTLKRLIDRDIVRIEAGVVFLPDRSVGAITPHSVLTDGVALGAMLDFIHHHHDARGQAQLSNAVTLFRLADVRVSPQQVSQAFTTLQSLLKARGDKRLVLEVARRSIEASKAPGRGPEQAKDEAVAAICGVSWVYQRTGRLAQAATEAQHSLELGLAIGWERNTAFCKKCLGRLRRLDAESIGDPAKRIDLLKESERLLREAIERFSALGIEPEVGDSYSLLARTYIVANRLQDARNAVAEAEERLVEPGTKDYLDLQIVKGDLAGYTNHRTAERLYTDVLKEVAGGDAQRSEVFARAFLQRGRAWLALREPEKALADLRRAADIWDELEDPSADVAHWEIERRALSEDRDALKLLEAEPVAVRVWVARALRDRAAGRGATAKRAKLPEKYLRSVVREAKEQLAIERPEW